LYPRRQTDGFYLRRSLDSQMESKRTSRSRGRQHVAKFAQGRTHHQGVNSRLGLLLVRVVSALGAVVGLFLALLTYQFNHGCSFCALGANCPSVCLSTDTIAFIIVLLAIAVISLVVLVRSFLVSRTTKRRNSRLNYQRDETEPSGVFQRINRATIPFPVDALEGPCGTRLRSMGRQI